ncbi:MAG: hypothetical protein L3V56_03720 [Candidatus Magnetoovum sp. WYHC-5]|nr:hypothetical protein [Candidatus Magnetoovum sp. WYHC-5]
MRRRTPVKVIKELLKDTVAALLEKITGVDISKAELIEPKMQIREVRLRITDEREADFILKAQLKDGSQEIYHIEFQGCVGTPPFYKRQQHGVSGTALLGLSTAGL